MGSLCLLDDTRSQFDLLSLIIPWLPPGGVFEHNYLFDTFIYVDFLR